MSAEGELLDRLGIRHVDPATFDVVRVACGRGFTYRDGCGIIRDRGLRRRFCSLAIPPAWRDVRIARDAHAHIQAVGRDRCGRLQYIYHSEWVVVRDADKVDRLRTFGAALPRIRARLDRDLRRGVLDRTAVIACAVRLVARALLRPGYPSSLGEEGGRGAATLLKRHVTVEGTMVRLRFRGKGRRPVAKDLDDPLLARAIERLKSQPGARIFKEMVGRRQSPVSADELNAYLREIAAADLTARDFRTFYASSRALELLAGAPPASSQRKRRSQVLAAARDVSSALQNTPAIARKSYIHPLVLEAFERGGLPRALLRGPVRKGLSPAETGLMRLLEKA